jgi:hypothetical protein
MAINKNPTEIISASLMAIKFQESDFGRLPDVSVEIRNKRSIIEIDFYLFG